MEIFTLENSSEESSVCVSILCSEAGNDTKISNFTPHPASPLNFSLWSVDSSRTGTVAVEELFYFLYWLPVNRLFFPFSTVYFCWRHVFTEYSLLVAFMFSPSNYSV